MDKDQQESKEIALRVEGHTFIVREDGEPRVRDLELAEWMGFSRPRDVRKIIERGRKDGFFNDSDVRAIVARTENSGAAPREHTEFWLSQAGAIKVAMRSETPNAHALVNDVIRVYLAAQRQRFEVAVPASGPTVEELLVRLDAAEARHALQIAEMQRHLRVLAASAEDHARVSDSREMERRLRDKIHAAADKCGVTFHAMHGALRDGINQRVPSYRDILRKNAADALGLLDDYIDGRRMFVPGRQRRRANQAPLGRVRKPRAPRGQGVIVFPAPGPAKA